MCDLYRFDVTPEYKRMGGRRDNDDKSVSQNFSE